MLSAITVADHMQFWLGRREARLNIINPTVRQGMLHSYEHTRDMRHLEAQLTEEARQQYRDACSQVCSNKATAKADDACEGPGAQQRRRCRSGDDNSGVARVLRDTITLQLEKILQRSGVGMSPPTQLTVADLQRDYPSMSGDLAVEIVRLLSLEQLPRSRQSNWDQRLRSLLDHIRQLGQVEPPLGCNPSVTAAKLRFLMLRISGWLETSPGSSSKDKDSAAGAAGEPSLLMLQ